jgi:hypothetical protein
MLLAVCGLLVLAGCGLLGIGLIQLRLNKGHAAVKESEREQRS